MLYSIHHRTHFHYSAAIRESIMELRMQPCSDSFSRCLWFDVQITPRPRISAYRDCWDNMVHFFDVPGLHEELQIATNAVVEVQESGSAGEGICASWDELDAGIKEGDYWDFLLPSRFARPTELLCALSTEWEVERRDDPLRLLEELRTRIYGSFSYAPQSTRADSPIDEALDARRGVCQDFTHIFIALARQLGIPCRYVSGYLHHADSDRSHSNATHAWAEAWLPQLGWIGFDPTNNKQTDARHIRTAIGRDYADVPPTRGVYKGRAVTELKVEVKVERIAARPTEALSPLPPVAMGSAGGLSTPSAAQGAGALSAVWPPPATVFVDDVSEQAQQQQQSTRRATGRD
jgi:transglutaminase-like putative cysteine protease